MEGVEFQLVDGAKLNYNTYAQLQREGYADILQRSRASDAHMTQDYYRWKYHDAPAGHAKIAIAYEGERMVAATAMYPLDLRCGNDSARSWQACDVATIPSARGKGYFQGCLRTLQQAVASQDVFFGFPNANSIPGFVKLGWRENQTVTTWVRPSGILGNHWSECVTDTHLFGSGQDALADRLSACGKTSLYRSADYLNWRYVAHPIYSYSCLLYCEAGEQLGFTILRTTKVLDHRVSLVMDLWGVTSRIEKVLLRHAAAWANEQRTPRMVMLDTGISPRTALAAGFVPVPASLLPKKQVLMGSGTSGMTSDKIMSSRWRAQMGDWDVF